MVEVREMRSKRRGLNHPEQGPVLEREERLGGGDFGDPAVELRRDLVLSGVDRCRAVRQLMTERVRLADYQNLSPGTDTVRDVTNADRHSQSLALAGDLLDDIELSRLESAKLLLKASRLARLTQDEAAQEWLDWEINGYPADAKVDTLKASGRVVSTAKGEMAMFSSLAELEVSKAAEETRLSAMQVGTFGGDFAIVASREHRAALTEAANGIAQLGTVASTVTAKIHSWATRTYHELLFSDLQADLFAAAQAEIDSRLIPLSDTALSKIEAISERLRNGEPESVSHAMSTVRRLITIAADALFPPSDEPYVLGETPMSVKANAVLNRLKAYADQCGVSKGRRDRLSHTIHDIWERASAGDHADIDVVEARYLFLQTYIVLGEFLALPSPSAGRS